MIVRGAFPNTEIHLSAGKGDRFRLYKRNKGPNDIPLAICYNLGSDFAFRTPQEQKARVFAMLKMLRESVNGVIEDIGKLVREHLRKMAKGVTSANIPCHSVESSWRVVKLGRKGGGPPCPGGLPGLGKHS